MSKATTCKEAIKNWESKNNTIGMEAKDISLICQFPPIEKLDESLNTLDVCEKLSLATNEIERIIYLKLRSLKILSLGRNQIKKI